MKTLLVMLAIVAGCSSTSSRKEEPRYTDPSSEKAVEGMEQMEKSDPALQSAPPSAINPSF